MCRLPSLFISMNFENLDSRSKGLIADLSTSMAFFGRIVWELLMYDHDLKHVVVDPHHLWESVMR